MAIIVPNGAEQTALKMIINYASPENLVLKLYTNNYTPIATSTESDFTVASGGGYSSVTLTGASWTVSTNGSGQAEAVYAQQTFTFTGALSGSATIYGWVLVQSSSGYLIAAEKSANTFTPASNGDTWYITPRLQLQSIN